MTLRTKHDVQCKCGHIGQILLSENDQSFSTNWQKYSLENLDGSAYSIDGDANWVDIFSNMNIKCPACQNKLDIQSLK
jgi:hypothetical protein